MSLDHWWVTQDESGELPEDEDVAAHEVDSVDDESDHDEESEDIDVDLQVLPGYDQDEY